jgi:hypothetical protein
VNHCTVMKTHCSRVLTLSSASILHCID